MKRYKPVVEDESRLMERYKLDTRVIGRQKLSERVPRPHADYIPTNKYMRYRIDPKRGESYIQFMLQRRRQGFIASLLFNLDIFSLEDRD